MNLHPMPDTEEGIIHRRIKDIWLKARSDAMFGTSDQEVIDILDEAHDKSMEVGFQRYLDYITAKWHANLKTLNEGTAPKP